MKQVWMIFLAALLCISVAACSGSGDGEENGAPAERTEAVETEAPDEKEPDTAGAESDYPKRAIEMVVPFAAGGTTDVNARMFAVQLEKHLGQPITITNQSGASGAIGTKYALDADADGYTILYAAETIGLFQTMQLSDISYDDFTPVVLTVNDPKVVVVAGDSPYDTIEDLLEDIESNPGKIQMAQTGAGSSGHIQGLVFNHCGYDLATTAYDGGANALLAVMGKQVAFTNSNLSTVLSYFESGDLKPLAVFSDARLDALPDVPALTEALPEAAEYVSMPFTPQSVLVSRDTPDEIVQIIKAAAQAALQEPDWVEFTESYDYELLYEKYPTDEAVEAFFQEWTSKVCWLLYDNDAANANPEDFGIPRP